MSFPSEIILLESINVPTMMIKNSKELANLLDPIKHKVNEENVTQGQWCGYLSQLLLCLE